VAATSVPAFRTAWTAASAIGRIASPRNGSGWTNDSGPTPIAAATDGSNATIKATVKVVADKPPVSSDYEGISDAEVQAAAVAADLARTSPEVWALEAEQVLAGASVNGLDRESVYELIESYGVA